MCAYSFDLGSTTKQSFSDLSLLAFISGELSCISRHDIPHVEKMGRTELLQQLLYLASVYDLKAILQAYSAVVSRIE